MDLVVSWEGGNNSSGGAANAIGIRELDMQVVLADSWLGSRLGMAWAKNKPNQSKLQKAFNRGIITPLAAPSLIKFLFGVYLHNLYVYSSHKVHVRTAAGLLVSRAVVRLACPLLEGVRG
jgi:hypothetical protein